MKAAIHDSINLPTSITTITTTAEDETLKRNTDCVYFLASPLTCKKGNECEFRHSEDARMNPRDCWYWMNGNCLNPNCSFRHPPLDGLLGTPAAASTRSSHPPSLAVPAAQLPAAYVPASNLGKQQANPGKQATPCFYFQKGLCLKGDRCPFMHEPTFFGDNPVPQPAATKVATFVHEPQILKKALGGIQKCTQPQKMPQANITRPVEAPRQVKAPLHNEAAMPRNGIAIRQTLPQTSSMHDVLPRYRPSNAPPVVSENSIRAQRFRQPNPLDDHSVRNGKEPGESSPGFDVLVDDKRRGSEYYHKEEGFGRMAGHEGRHPSGVNEFDYSRSSDYNGQSRYDQDKYKDSRGYNIHGRVQDHYVREQRKPSSERISERPALPERRGFSRADSPDQVDRSDLRYRLAKQRKVSGSRTAISPDRRDDMYRRDDRDRNVSDPRYRGLALRESHTLPRESSSTNRLQGRIMLPGRSSSASDYVDSRLERETDRERRGRLSPVRLPSSSYQGRLQDRIKRTEEDFTTEGRNLRGAPIRRDEVDNNVVNFAGPKSLAELKQPKAQRVSLREQRNTSEGSLSFEGPKPLNVILKRKRETSGSGDDQVSGNEEEINHREKGEFLRSSSRVKQNEVPESEIDEANQRAYRMEERDSTVGDTMDPLDEYVEEEEEEEGLITADGDELAHEVQPSEQKESEIEMEDTITTDKLEDNELETYDQGYDEAEYYEQIDGGEDFKEEDTNVDAVGDEDFSDDEDGDDFAKRIGVMFS